MNPWNYRMPASDEEAPVQPDMSSFNINASTSSNISDPSKGVQSKKSKTSTDKNSKVSKRDIYTTPDVMASRIQGIEDLPIFQEQRGNLSDIKNKIAMVNSVEDTPNYDGVIQPFLALADAWSRKPSNLSGHFKPQGESSRSKLLTSLQDKETKQRENYNKTLLDALTKSKEGSDTNSLSNQLAQMTGYNTGMNNSLNDRLSVQEQKAIDLAHRQTVNSVRNDKVLKERLTQYQNLDNAMSLITKADHVTPQQFDEFQQAIRSNLGIKGTGGVDERDRTRLSEAGFNIDRINQFLSGNPANIAKDNALLKHVQNLAQVEQENIKQQSQDQLDVASGGYGYIYDDPKNARYKNSLQALIKAKAKGFESNSQTPTGGEVATVRVKNAQGQIGDIPKGQLNDALAQGYSVVK